MDNGQNTGIYHDECALSTADAAYISGSDNLSKHATGISRSDLRNHALSINRNGTATISNSSTAEVTSLDMMVTQIAMRPTMNSMMENPVESLDESRQNALNDGTRGKQRDSIESLDRLIVPTSAPGTTQARPELLDPNMHTASFNFILSQIFHELRGQYSENCGHLETMDMALCDHSEDYKAECVQTLLSLPSSGCALQQNHVFHIEDIFHLKRTIGFGASCTVIKAQHIETGRFVALKQIPRGQRKGGNVTSKDLMSTERALLDVLDHANIVSFFAAYETLTHHFLVTELLAGGTLLDKVLTTKPEETRAVGYLHDVLSAVSYMHSMNIVHNDLKLENMVLTELGNNGAVKLIDFGHSQYVKPLRNYKVAFGTLHYVPPEITRALQQGRSGDELKKSDVWCIGVCGYVLITGYIPFGGNTIKEVMRNIHRREKKGLRFSGNCNLKKECIDFLERLLCINVAARLTAEQALHHEFITGSADDKKLMDLSDLSHSREADSSSGSEHHHLNMVNKEVRENKLESESVPSADRISLRLSSGSDVDTELTSSSED